MNENHGWPNIVEISYSDKIERERVKNVGIKQKRYMTTGDMLARDMYRSHCAEGKGRNLSKSFEFCEIY